MSVKNISNDEVTLYIKGVRNNQMEAIELFKKAIPIAINKLSNNDN